MSEIYYPYIEMEEILRDLRKQRYSIKSDKEPKKDDTVVNDSEKIDTIAVELLDHSREYSENVGLARENADVGKKNFPMKKVPWPFRWLARTMGKLILFFSQVITVPQRTFNHAVLETIEIAISEIQAEKARSQTILEELSTWKRMSQQLLDPFGESLENNLHKLYLEWSDEILERERMSFQEALDSRVRELDQKWSQDILPDVKMFFQEALDSRVRELDQKWSHDILPTQRISFQEALDSRIRELDRKWNDDIMAPTLGSLQEKYEKRMRELDDEWRKTMEVHLNTLNSSIGRINDQLSKRIDENTEKLNVLSDTVSEHKNKLVSINDGINKNLDDHSNKLHHLERDSREIRKNLVLQTHRLELFLQEARKRLPEPYDKKQMQVFIEELKRFHDPLYLTFEDRFRGSRDEIKDRFKQYLPIIFKAASGKKSSKILDLGCGRGEWLELLSENSIDAVGVDINRVMVENARKWGLNVTEQDALEYFESQADNSLEAVTGFHFVEHLNLNELLKLFDESLRVLKPGGVIIFETPNPANILVGSHLFYLDPTHKNPLPPLLMEFLAESKGFCRIEILELHPYAETFISKANTELEKLFGQFFFGPQDYAVIGYKV